MFTTGFRFFQKGAVGQRAAELQAIKVEIRPRHHMRCEKSNLFRFEAIFKREQSSASASCTSVGKKKKKWTEEEVDRRRR